MIQTLRRPALVPGDAIRFEESLVWFVGFDEDYLRPERAHWRPFVQDRHDPRTTFIFLGRDQLERSWVYSPISGKALALHTTCFDYGYTVGKQSV